MAPTLPVYSGKEIQKLYPQLANERDCELYTLVQNQCTFDGNKCVCLPFKRIFARCLDSNFDPRKQIIGYKLRPVHRSMNLRGDISGRSPHEKVYRNIELTTSRDNEYEKYFTGDKKSPELTPELLQDFLRADKIFRQKVKEYYERQRREQ